MIDVAADVHPLTAFKRQTTKFGRLLRKTHRPIVLTVEGKAHFVVFEVEAYEEWKDRIDTLEAANEALAAPRQGRPAAQVHSELRKSRFGVSRVVRKTR